MKRVGVYLALAAIGAGAVACDNAHILGPEASALTMELNPDSVLLRSVGTGYQLTPSVRDESGRPVKAPILNWISSDSMTVRVSESGEVTGLHDGVATITVRAGQAATASVRVTVRASVVCIAWVSAVANRELDTANDRDSTRVVARDPSWMVGKQEQHLLRGDSLEITGSHSRTAAASVHEVGKAEGQTR